MKIFKQKIIVPNIGTADPEVHVCYQISDWAMMGSNEDLRLLFDPHMDGMDATRNSPEQYMWLGAIQRVRPDLGLAHIDDRPPEAIAGTIDFMTNNLVILDTKAQFNFYSGKYPDLPDDQPVNMRHEKWTHWYGGMR